MGIATLTCDSLHFIDTWLFNSINKNCRLFSKSRESFDIFVPRILQPSVNDLSHLVIISKLWNNN